MEVLIESQAPQDHILNERMDHRKYAAQIGEITRRFTHSGLGLGVVGFVTSGLPSLGFGV